jgi:Na+/proline symporter
VIRKGHPQAILIMISLIALTFVTMANFDHHYSALAVLGPKKLKHATPFILPMPFP